MFKHYPTANSVVVIRSATKIEEGSVVESSYSIPFLFFFPPPQFKPKPNVNPRCKLLTCFYMSGIVLLSDDFIFEWKT